MTTQEIIDRDTRSYFKYDKIRLASAFAAEHENARVRGHVAELLAHGETSLKADFNNLTRDEKAIIEALDHVAGFRVYNPWKVTFTYSLD